MAAPADLSDYSEMGGTLSVRQPDETGAEQRLDDRTPDASNGPLKRRATSAALSDIDEGSRKKVKTIHEPLSAVSEQEELKATIDGDALVADLAQELECGCCSAVVYRPVVVMPCQHFFCGRCALFSVSNLLVTDASQLLRLMDQGEHPTSAGGELWRANFRGLQNGGTHCPTCRGTSNKVEPSRPLEKMVEVLVRADPSQARSEREKEQADEVYTGGSLRVSAYIYVSFRQIYSYSIFRYLTHEKPLLYRISRPATPTTLDLVPTAILETLTAGDVPSQSGIPTSILRMPGTWTTGLPLATLTVDIGR
jgi:hypothetical protein